MSLKFESSSFLPFGMVPLGSNSSVVIRFPVALLSFESPAPSEAFPEARAGAAAPDLGLAALV